MNSHLSHILDSKAFKMQKKAKESYSKANLKRDHENDIERQVEFLRAIKRNNGEYLSNLKIKLLIYE